MKFTVQHCNINVTNLDKSKAFYQKALGLTVVREHKSQDGSFTLCYLGDATTTFELELTCLRDHPQPYNLGENESHICFAVEEYEKAHALHREMDCICFENEAMGLYFIHDPDNYWIEIIPEKHSL